MSYSQPGSLDELLKQLAESQARPILLAGGTDWMVERQLGAKPAPSVIDLSQVAELTPVQEEADGIRIGSRVTYRQLIEDRRFQAWPMLQEMAQRVGAWQIQARGTLGGNIATGSPAGDSLPVLIAYGAELGLASLRGSRQVPIDGFYTGYRQNQMAADEVIVSIWLPRPQSGAQQMYRKVGTRRAQSISKVAFAGFRDGATVRLAMASVGPTVASLKETAKAIVKGEDPLAALARDIRPIDDVRSNAKYRWFVARNLVQSFAKGTEAGS